MKTFINTLGALRDIYDTDSETLPHVFWHTIDNLPNDQLFKWVEKLLEIKGLLQGQDYLRVVGIQHQYRQFENWTVKQKRSIAMDLIKNWYDVEFRSELQ